MTTGRELSGQVPGVTEGELERAFAPYIVESLDTDDPRWRERVARTEDKMRRPPKTLGKGITEDGVRTSAGVDSHYDALWSAVQLDDALHSTHAAWYEWRHRGMLARTIGRKRVFHLVLSRVFDWLGPASVCEVGFGWGLNLLTLSVQFPNVHFGGVELTEAGVRTARTLAANPTTPSLLRDFVTDRVRDAGALQRLDLRQGTAEALPLPDKSVDMVITVLALEQMDRIRESVLRELARIARRHVVMIEPFADWNADRHQREYIRRYDYWSAAIDDLNAFGLVPVLATADLPQKLTFRAGLVITECGSS